MLEIFPKSRLRVKLAAFLGELAGFFFHPFLQRRFVRDSLLRCIFPNVFRYLHAARVPVFRAALKTKFQFQSTDALQFLAVVRHGRDALNGFGRVGERNGCGQEENANL